MNIYNIFDSIGIIVDAKLKDLQFDRTLQCEVCDISQLQQGKCGVWYGNEKLIANTHDFSLKVQDTVYVGIPQNDISNAYIISKKFSTASAMSSDAFVSMYAYSTNARYALNKDVSAKNVYWSSGDEEYKVIDDINPYNSVKLKVSFEVKNFTRTDMEGNYGIKFYIKTVENIGQTDEYCILHENTFNSSQMNLLNQYYYNGAIEQEVFFDISTLKNIIGMRLVVYTDEDLYNNEEIIASNISVEFGYRVTDNMINTPYIYTQQSNAFGLEDNDNAFELYLRWITNANNSYQIYTYPLISSNEISYPDGIFIKWYQRTDETSDWVELPNMQNQFICNHTVSLFAKQSEYQCKILYYPIENDAPVEKTSNIITFLNAHEQRKDIFQNVTIKSNTNTQLSNIYNADGKIIDIKSLLSGINLYVNATFNPSILTTNSNLICKGIWRFPIQNSILVYRVLETDDINITDTDIELTKFFTFGTDRATVDKTFEHVLDTITIYLNEYYLPNYSNNTITFELQLLQDEQILQKDIQTITFDITKEGHSKKDNILFIALKDPDNNLRYAIEPEETLTAIATLYNSNGEPLDMSDGEIVWKWLYRPEEKLTRNFLNLASYYNSAVAHISAGKMPTTNTTNIYDLGFVLMAEYQIKNDKNEIVKKVVDYLPIAINNSNSIDYSFNCSILEGPTHITYDSSGGNATAQQAPYSLYAQIRSATNDIGYEKIEGIMWECRAQGSTDEQALSFYPSLLKLHDGYWLSPNRTYTKEANNHFTLCAYSVKSSPSPDIEYYPQPVWIQPIIIDQLNTFSSYIDNWDGSFKIDESGNTLMAGRLGAGRKETDGTFSGVLMGDWIEKVNDQSITESGIYGFDHGIQSYGLKENGNAFFGKSGSGRINFNGNEGVIYSDNFNGIFAASGNILTIDEESFTYRGVGGPETQYYQKPMFDVDEAPFNEYIMFNGLLKNPDAVNNMQILYAQDEKTPNPLRFDTDNIPVVMGGYNSMMGDWLLYPRAGLKRGHAYTVSFDIINKILGAYDAGTQSGGARILSSDETHYEYKCVNNSMDAIKKAIQEEWFPKKDEYGKDLNGVTFPDYYEIQFIVDCYGKPVGIEMQDFIQLLDKSDPVTVSGQTYQSYAPSLSWPEDRCSSNFDYTNYRLCARQHVSLGTFVVNPNHSKGADIPKEAASILYADHAKAGDKKFDIEFTDIDIDQNMQKINMSFYASDDYEQIMFNTSYVVIAHFAANTKFYPPDNARWNNAEKNDYTTVYTSVPCYISKGSKKQVVDFWQTSNTFTNLPRLFLIKNVMLQEYVPNIVEPVKIETKYYNTYGYKIGKCTNYLGVLVDDLNSAENLKYIPPQIIEPDKAIFNQQIQYNTLTGETLFRDYGTHGTYFNLRTGELITNNAILREDCKIYGTIYSNKISNFDMPSINLHNIIQHTGDETRGCFEIFNYNDINGAYLPRNITGEIGDEKIEINDYNDTALAIVGQNNSGGSGGGNMVFGFVPFGYNTEDQQFNGLTIPSSASSKIYYKNIMDSKNIIGGYITLYSTLEKRALILDKDSDAVTCSNVPTYTLGLTAQTLDLSGIGQIKINDNIYSLEFIDGLLSARAGQTNNS